MPDLDGVSRDRAEDMLDDYENVEFSSSQTSEYPANQIINQDPEVGANVIPEETTVYLTYSTEPEFSLQNLKGESREAAENYLESSNLEGTFNTSFSDSVPEGNVIEHSPGPYSTVKEGDEITFTISDGPDEPDEPEQSEDNQSEEMEAVIPVEVSESDQEDGVSYDIRIVYEDATTSGPTIFTEENISETKTYRVPLEVTPESDGTYTLYVDNEEVQSNSFSYGE
ncbi:PASTA domain-containing protein [Salibacterium salarium]|uniref:PASTA domain-containing protein n=1 Tax=Salibacterium salarium TaxID=284579 RepID=UPI001FE8D4B1|nr:PASTA domain-containing protein [Salibacterium salarium]